MNIAILSRNRNLYSTRRLVEAGEARGHTMRVRDPLRWYMRIASHNPEVHYKGKLITGIEAVIPC
ncbi:30S ribosomal protein S6--L-glutamate ligase, partial [bacterium]|nr:30S ribosomal protein S6--L-glutamate ligase [bacterium]